MALSRRSVLLSYAVGCIIAASLAVYSPVVDEASAYTVRAKIAITGDSGFTPENGVVGGSGTQGDPYVISGWDIQSAWNSAIEIQNTDSHFVISDCYLHSSNIYAVRLINANNGTMTSNLVSFNYLGLSASSCDNLVIDNNTISDSSYCGVDLMYCNGTVVTNNSISNSRLFGMAVNRCVAAVLRDNTFTADGIEMWASTVWESNTHVIDTTNTVNGLPILYYANETELVIDSVPVGELLLANCTNVMVTGLDISGPEVGIFSAFCSNETISNCTVADVPYSLWFWACDSVHIHNNSISNALNDHMYVLDPGMAVYAYLIEGMIIEHNVVNNSDFGAFIGEVMDLTFRGNTVSYGGYACALGVYSAENVLVEGNELFAKDGSVQFSDSLNCTVLNNSMSGNYNDAFYASNVTGLTLWDNDLVNNGFGMRMQQVNDAQISFNSVTGGGSYTNYGQYGIDIETGASVTLDNNTVADVPDGGVKVSGVNGVTLSGNIIQRNLNDGVLLLNSQNIRVLNNTISSNGDDGLFESGASGAFEIIGNDILSNTDSGIETSHAAEITRNWVYDNGWYGIGLAGIDSKVYHNNIMGNLIQAFQNDGYANDWDNGYPDGGNYWSDYTGTDLMNGAAQDVPGSDGIGDTPRAVQVGEQDRYPLMTFFSWNRPPVASFDVTPVMGDLTTVFEFNASGTWDYETPDGDLMFRWDFDGDGMWDTAWSSVNATTYQYSSPGNYTVTLQVRDGNGTLGEYSLQVEVVEVIPEMPGLYLPVTAAALCLLVLALGLGARRRHRSGPD